jgi:L-fuculose-phosphate aldolase
MSEAQIRIDLLEVCRRLHRQGLVAAQDGNVSALLPAPAGAPITLMITPSGMALGDVSDDDLVVIDGFGQVEQGWRRPSSEWQMHVALYHTRADIKAVVHAHPPYATAFAIAGRPLDRPVLPEIIARFGAIPLVPYATPSTRAVGDGLAPLAAEGFRGFLLENHGATSAGESLWEAFYRMEKMEHAARILWLAEALGGAKQLPPAEVDRIREIYG